MAKNSLSTEEAKKKDKERRKLICRALSFIMPNDRAEKATKALWSTYGSFSGVVGAPVSELKRLETLGEDGGRFLELVFELARESLDEVGENTRIYDSDVAVEAFRPKFLRRKNEIICVMFLDGRGRMIYNGVLAEGSVSEVPIYIRKLISLCIEYNAYQVILAHNHPSGNPMPSRNDLVVTRQIAMALEGINAYLYDHIIYAEEDFCSFRKAGIIGVDTKQDLERRRAELDLARKMEQRILEIAADYVSDEG